MVQTVQKTLTTKIVDFEFGCEAVTSYRFCFQIDGQLVVVVCRDQIVNGLYFVGSQPDGKDTVFRAIIVENVCKGFSDNAAKAIIIKCPYRVFST